MGIRKSAGLTWNHLLMRVDISAGKGTSGMNNQVWQRNWQNEHEAWKQVSKLFENQDPAPKKAPACDCCR